MKKYLISILAVATSMAAWSNDQQKINDRLNDTRVQHEALSEIPPKNITQDGTSVASTPQKQTLKITAEELVKRPDLVLRAIQPALIQGNAETLKIIFPIYQKIPSEFHHPLFNQWAEAILAKHVRNYRQSIRLYREILAHYPDNDIARLQLAIILLINNELEAAEDQFKKLRAEPSLPTDMMDLIDKYLETIRNRDRWTLSGGLTYLHDPNINNAPKSGTTYGQWISPARESAEGVGFNLNIGKKWSWKNGFYNELRLNSSGKYYWDNHKYNEANGRISTGIGFQNAQTDITLLPFIEQTLYAGGSARSNTLKRFSKAGGVTLELQHWLNSQWQLNSYYEYAEQRYISRKHLNGNFHAISIGGLYLANAKRYFFANINYNRISTRDRDDSYFRRGISLGWQQEWGWGLSTRVTASLAQKRYKDAMPIFQITQRNKEYGIQTSIWHRAVHYWGITPRLTYNFTRTRSNHTFYSYDKQRIFLDFSRSF